MRVRTTQIIDYWFGIPICLALSLWRRITSFTHDSSNPLAPKKILFLELSEMGSAIIAHSALEQTKRRFSNAELFFMVFSKNKESVSLLNIIPKDNLVLIDESSFLKLLLTTISAILRLRSCKIDTIIDLELFSRFTTIVSFLTGARNRVGFHNYTAEGLYRGSLLTHRVFYNPHQHMELNFLALILALSASPNDRPMLKDSMEQYRLPMPEHTPTESEVTALWELMRTQNSHVTPESKLLVLNPDPGDALPIRGWPMERYCAVIEQLLAINSNLYCVVIGLKGARKYADALIKAVGSERVVDLTGRTKTLREVVTLFTQAKLLLTNDSGPAHFASLTNIKSIALFGPETPRLYGAIGVGKRNISAEYACSPCLSAHNHRYTICNDNKCLKAIPESQILREAQTLLNE